MIKSIVIYILLLCINHILANQFPLDITPDNEIQTVSMTGSASCPIPNADNKCNTSYFTGLIDAPSSSCTVPNKIRPCSDQQNVTISIRPRDWPNHNEVCDGKTNDIVHECTHRRFATSGDETFHFTCDDLLSHSGWNMPNSEYVAWDLGSEYNNPNAITGATANLWSASNNKIYPNLYALHTNVCLDDKSEGLGKQVKIDLLTKAPGQRPTAHKIKSRKLNYIAHQQKYNDGVTDACNLIQGIGNTDLYSHLVGNMENDIWNTLNDTDIQRTMRNKKDSISDCVIDFNSRIQEVQQYISEEKKISEGCQYNEATPPSNRNDVEQMCFDQRACGMCKDLEVVIANKTAEEHNKELIGNLNVDITLLRNAKASCDAVIDKKIENYVEKASNWYEVNDGQELTQMEQLIAAFCANEIDNLGIDYDGDDENYDNDEENGLDINCDDYQGNLTTTAQKKHWGIQGLTRKHPRKLTAQDRTPCGTQNIDKYQSLEEIALYGGFINGDGSKNQGCIDIQKTYERARFCKYDARISEKQSQIDTLNNSVTNLQNYNTFLTERIDPFNTDSLLLEEIYSNCSTSCTDQYELQDDIDTFMQFVNDPSVYQNNPAVFTGKYKCVLSSDIQPTCDSSSCNKSEWESYINSLDTALVSNEEGSIDDLNFQDALDYIVELQSIQSNKDNAFNFILQQVNTIETLTKDNVDNGNLGYSTSGAVFANASGLKTIIERIIKNQTDTISANIQLIKDECNKHKCTTNEDNKYRGSALCAAQENNEELYASGQWGQGFKNDEVFIIVNTTNNALCDGDLLSNESNIDFNDMLNTYDTNLESSIRSPDGFLYNQDITSVYDLCAKIDHGDFLTEQTLHIGNADFKDEFVNNYLVNKYSWKNMTIHDQEAALENVCPSLCSEPTMRRRLMYMLGAYKNLEMP